MVQRLAKGVLPANTSLHKDAILALSKGATVFINYLAHAANTASLSGGKRTIPPTAVVEALAELEFASFGPRVEAELKKFNEVQTGKRNEYRRKVKEGKMGGAKGDEGEDGGGEEEEEGGEEEGEGRAKKRVRREEGEEGMEEGEEGRGRRESGTGDPSAQLQTGYREFEPEDPDDDDGDDFDAEGQGGEEASHLEIRRRASQEEEEKEEEEDEEEEEEDDEDEYPDEGRRLSSVEREANGSFGGPGDDPGSSADEVLSDDEGSD